MPAQTIIERSDRDDFLRMAQVCQRYGGCSHMWIVRRMANDPDFPRPTYFGKRRFWRLADLVAWERKRASVAA